MKNTKSCLQLFCLMVSFIVSMNAMAEISVVVGSGSAISSADADELKRLYLGKSKSLGGTSATPLNQKNGDTSESFNKSLLKKSSSQVKAYWSKLVFTGKGTPPKELASDADVISEVGSDPNAIGYINSSAVTGDLKVLLTL